MSINIWTDSMQHAALLGKPVLFTNWLIQRDIIPDGWYCYDLRGTHKSPSTRTTLVDHAADYHAGTVLSPIPLKHEGTASRRVNGTFYLLGEEMTLEQFCEEHDLAYPQDNREFVLRPASLDEVGLFYSEEKLDEALGTVGHLRMDFGHGEKEFWHTWWPHNEDRFNTPEFKEVLQRFVDDLRQTGLLKNLGAMDAYCWQHGGSITEDRRSYGYIAETENYRFCLRCTPFPGEYQGYLYCYDLCQQEMYRQEHPVVGRVTFASGEQQEFTDSKALLQAIREELPFRSTTGFRFETLTDDPEVKKAVDDILLDFAGEDNSRRTCNYGLTETGKQALTLVSSMHRNREPLLHCAVFLELTAPDYDALKLLQTDVLTELVRSKLNVDRLMLRQQEGFVSVMPAGRNAFGAQFERVLPASSVANLYPFNYSGKTDPHGFYIGKDKYGANILVDFDKRDDDKTSANILILGNSGQGKSYLLKLLLLNFLEAGKSVISLDVEHEQKDMCETVGGCFMDLMGGVYRINPLEPKCWDDGSGPEDRDAPEAFRKSTRLSQHISFLKDFFRAYKDFSDRHIDAIEIMVGKLYAKWGISDSTNFAGLKPQDYPILSDLYKLIEQEYREYDGNCHQLYTAELLQEILLGLHSMCQGAEAQFFNGHTNVTSSRFIVFGVKGLLQASKNVRGAMLFNILSYMSDRLLTIGNTTAALDELYVWLSDNVSVGTTIIEYIRNTLKRVRKKESNLIMASQNLEDFDREGIRELTKPLFAIPPHQFIFNCGSIDKRFYMDLLQLEEAEYNLIRFPQRGVCLFKCGNERYLLEVHAPAYKEALFGTAGGR